MKIRIQLDECRWGVGGDVDKGWRKVNEMARFALRHICDINLDEKVIRCARLRG